MSLGSFAHGDISWVRRACRSENFGSPIPKPPGAFSSTNRTTLHPHPTFLNPVFVFKSSLSIYFVFLFVLLPQDPRAIKQKTKPKA